MPRGEDWTLASLAVACDSRSLKVCLFLECISLCADGAYQCAKRTKLPTPHAFLEDHTYMSHAYDGYVRSFIISRCIYSSNTPSYRSSIMVVFTYKINLLRFPVRNKGKRANSPRYQLINPAQLPGSPFWLLGRRTYVKLEVL